MLLSLCKLRNLIGQNCRLTWPQIKSESITGIGDKHRQPSISSPIYHLIAAIYAEKWDQIGVSEGIRPLLRLRSTWMDSMERKNRRRICPQMRGRIFLTLITSLEHPWPKKSLQSALILPRSASSVVTLIENAIAYDFIVWKSTFFRWNLRKTISKFI